MRHLTLLTILCLAVELAAQVPVPFSTVEGRFMVQSQGRFEKIEPRPAREFFPMDGKLAYVDHEGDLKLFIGERKARLHRIDGGPFGEVVQAGDRLAWSKGDSLRTLRGEKASHVGEGVARFTVSDSLLVYHDSVAHELKVWWRNRSFSLAAIERSSARPQWSQGTNTVCFLDRSAMRLFLFHQGRTITLCDSTGMGVVVAGQDMVGYWDEHAREFRLWRPQGTERLADLRPRSAQAGKGLLAFVDAYGRLKCFNERGLHTLTDTMPSGYWVRDGLLLYLKGGHLMLFDGREAITVERYVPEQWEVSGQRLVYLDINRELRTIENGRRERIGREAGIAGFQLFGDAVLYTSPAGPVTVVRNGRSYLF